MESWNGISNGNGNGQKEWKYNEKYELVMNGNYSNFHFSVRLSTVSNLANSPIRWMMIDTFM